MDIRFLVHNSHLFSSRKFDKYDPHLRYLGRQKYIYSPKVLLELPIEKPGIYTLLGSRRTGKTTTLKLFVQRLLKLHKAKFNIAFFTGKLIEDAANLAFVINQYLANKSSGEIVYIIIDEISYVKDWINVIKTLALGGRLKNVFMLISSGDRTVVEQIESEIGSVEYHHIKHFNLYPLSFAEYLDLKEPRRFTSILQPRKTDYKSDFISDLFAEFNSYLIHGGYLKAINDMANDHKLKISTLASHTEYLRADFARRGKSEAYLKEILGAIIKSYGSQVSWNSMCEHMSISHTETISDYINLLEQLDFCYVQPTLKVEELKAAPRKNKKIIFNDPFIFHAVKCYLSPKQDHFNEQIKNDIFNNELSARLVESVVISHVKRHYPTYFIKEKGEIDVAYIKDNKINPIEVKWRATMFDKDLKLILKYKNGLIFSKNRAFHDIDHVKEIPLPVALALFS